MSYFISYAYTKRILLNYITSINGCSTNYRDESGFANDIIHVEKEIETMDDIFEMELSIKRKSNFGQVTILNYRLV